MVSGADTGQPREHRASPREARRDPSLLRSRRRTPVDRTLCQPGRGWRGCQSSPARRLRFKLLWRWRSGRQWQICPVHSRMEAAYGHCSSAALFAPQAMLNRISSACGRKVCPRARLKTGYKHTYGDISAPDCICWGYSSQSGTGTLVPRLQMWGLSHLQPRAVVSEQQAKDDRVLPNPPCSSGLCGRAWDFMSPVVPGEF